MAALLAASTAAAAAPNPVLGPAVLLAASPWHVQAGHSVQLKGRVVDPLGRRLVLLFRSAYPYPVATEIGSMLAAADGSFAFTVTPDRNTRYRVTLAGSPTGAMVQVGVAYPVRTTVKALPLGRAAVTITVAHPGDLHWGRAPVHWSFAEGFHGRFAGAPTTRTRDARPGVTVISETVALAAGHFRFRACFHAPGDGAVLDAGDPPGCSGRGYSGGGSLPSGFPSPRSITAAAAYLAGRAGRTAFAVVDSEGRLSGVHVHWTFVSASVVKAMLLVAYLRQLDAQGQHYVDGVQQLVPVPDDQRLGQRRGDRGLWSIVGDGGLYALAHRGGHDRLLDRRHLGQRADQRRRPGPLLLRDGLADPARVRRLRPPPALDHRRLRELGHPGGRRGRTATRSSSRAAGAARRSASSCTRWPAWSAPISPSRWPCMTDGDPSMGYGIDTIQGLTNVLRDGALTRLRRAQAAGVREAIGRSWARASARSTPA